MPLLAIAILLAAATPGIRSEKLAEGGYRIVVDGPGLTLEQGQARAAEEASRLCGGPATLGHYRWRSDERLGDSDGSRTPLSLTLEQEATCGAAPTPVATADGPSDWSPSSADVSTVLDLTERYFEARDKGRFADAWALLTPTMQAMSPLADWQRQAADFAQGAGAVRRRTPVAITWYDSPPGAEPGIYAAVDFDGEAEKLVLLCGYLVWRRQQDGSYRLARDEQNVVRRESDGGMTPEKLAQVRSAMGCREAS